MLTIQGKLTGFDFYTALELLTDNSGIDPPSVSCACVLFYFISGYQTYVLFMQKRRDEFMRISRLWRFLVMLKRAGVGMLAGGIASAEEGSCAVLCPACPQVGTMSTTASALANTQFIMMDGNFRMKCKDRSLVDPTLGRGLSYFANEVPYAEYIATCRLQTEVCYTHAKWSATSRLSFCLQVTFCDSSLRAIDQANTRGSALYLMSGVGACQCRHMMVRPNGVVDLQKGERFVIPAITPHHFVLTQC